MSCLRVKSQSRASGCVPSLRIDNDRGKTSLLNCIGTIDKPTRGDIFVCGTRIDARTSDADLADIRLRRLGFVFQQAGRTAGFIVLCIRRRQTTRCPPLRAAVQLAPGPDRSRERRAADGAGWHGHACVAAQASAGPPIAGRHRRARAPRPFAAQRRRAAARDHSSVGEGSGLSTPPPQHTRPSCVHPPPHPPEHSRTSLRSSSSTR